MELARLIEHLIKDLKGPEYVKPFLSVLYWECVGWKEWMLPIITYEQMTSDWLLPVLAYVVNQLCALIGPTRLHHFANTFLNLDRFEIFEASAVEEEASAVRKGTSAVEEEASAVRKMNISSGGGSTSRAGSTYS